jgi:hypothetical protein
MKVSNKTVSCLILISALYFEGCNKNDDRINQSPHADSIIYTDIIPDTSVYSVRDCEPSYGVSCLPIPDDTSAVIRFDVDHDNIMDLSVGVSTSYQFYSASNPIVNYTLSSGFGMLRTSDSVAGTEFYYYCTSATPFKLDSVISDKTSFTRGASTYHDFSSPNDPCGCNTFSGNTYYGFKIAKNGGYVFGWILMSYKYGKNEVTIKEFAYNKTLNKPIKAGQKE